MDPPSRRVWDPDHPYQEQKNVVADTLNRLDL